jgi:integrase/recombinase XerD
LLRFLFVVGIVPRDLAAAVPGFPSPRLASLPQGLDAATVAALLDSCDRHTMLGRRDFAILTVLVRLGLRAGEVAALLGDDIDWRAGELVIRGKRCPSRPTGAASRRRRGGGRLPTPRPQALDLPGFVPASLRAGWADVRRIRRDGPADRVASRRAGLPVIVGAHRLRHTAASEMARRGASLCEIAEVLRHRSESTTALYAKVDRAALDLAVRPWPGVGR